MANKGLVLSFIYPQIIRDTRSHFKIRVLQTRSFFEMANKLYAVLNSYIMDNDHGYDGK